MASTLNRALPLIEIAFAAAMMMTPSASAQTYTVLHSFFGVPVDGANPQAGVVLDAAGNAYGTTFLGSLFDYGTVFEVSPAGNETLLLGFGVGPGGMHPVAGVILDSAGNVYGTTFEGGASTACGVVGCGVVYKMGPTGDETVLYNFTGGSDGLNPRTGLVRAASGEIYGTTSSGGSATGCGGEGCGIVFKLDTAGTETVLHTFTGGADGAGPGTLIRDKDGNLYGTTFTGGLAGGCGGSGCGLVFKLNATAGETTLYRFTGGADGANPSGMIRDAAGEIYGAAGGGAANAGVLYRLDPSGRETVLYNFTGGADGAGPTGVIRDAQGNLYGSTYAGGASGAGVIFQLDPAGKLTVLYSFTGGADGRNPSAVTADAAGNLYGTTAYGGTTGGFGCLSAGCGVVFKLAVAPK